AQATTLARTLLGRAVEPSTADADAIARESGGNPFFVAELVDFVRSGAGSGSRVELGDADRHAAAASPTIALDQFLWARVVRLTEPAQRLLEVIAVSGQPLAQTAACRAVDLGQDERAALAVLRSGRLIRSTSTGSSTIATTNPAAGGVEREVIET